MEGTSDVKLIDVKQGLRAKTYVVSYIPPAAGKYIIPAKYWGEEISQNPFKVAICSKSDVQICIKK